MFLFITGIHIINASTKKSLSRIVKTRCYFRKLSGSEIRKYVNEDPNFKTYAVGYDSLNHISSTFTEKIEGSYHNLIYGIPLETVVEMLYRMGYELQ